MGRKDTIFFEPKSNLFFYENVKKLKDKKNFHIKIIHIFAAVFFKPCTMGFARFGGHVTGSPF